MLRHLAPASASASIAAAILGLAAPALAGPVGTAVLTNEAENPPAIPLLTSIGDPRPISSGTATFELNDALTAMTFTATVVNIDFTGAQTPADTNDDLHDAHIHAGPDVTPTTNAGVVWGFFGNPFNETDPNDQVVTPLEDGVGGTISGKWDLSEGNGTTLAAQLDHLLNGRAYINFHTTQFPLGEVRGNIVFEPSEVIPLPPAAVPGLLGLALVAAGPLRSALRNRTRRSNGAPI